MSKNLHTNSQDACSTAEDLEFADQLLSVRQQMKRLAGRYERTPAAREDLVGDVMLRAWRARKLYREGSFIGWLNTIMKNCSINNHRGMKHKGEIVSQGPDNDMDLLPVEFDPCAALAKKRQQEALENAIHQLGDRQRQAIELFLTDASIEEGIKIMGCSSSAYRGLQSRAKQKLKSLCQVPQTSALPSLDI